MSDIYNSVTIAKRCDEFFVYLVKTNKGHKIGRTQNIEQRMKLLERETGEDVEILHVETFRDLPHAIETAFHHHFRDKLVSGREYFNLSEDDVELIKSKTFHNLLIKKIEKTIKSHQDRHIKSVSDPIIHEMRVRQRLINEINKINNFLERALDFENDKEKFKGEHKAIEKYICQSIGINPNYCNSK